MRKLHQAFKETNTDDSVLGWDEGVMDMTLGEKSVLTIPG